MDDALAKALAADLAAAPYGGKEPVINQWMESTGLSRSTLLRHAKRAGGYRPQERKRRSDAGIPRCGITDEGLSYLVALMKGSHRKTGSIEMPLTVAHDIAQKDGVIPKEASIFTVGRLLREKNMSRKALQQNYTTDGQTVSSHHVWLKTEHPNHMHQVDVSACLHWYFRKRGGLAFKHKALDLAGGKKAAPYRKIRDHILRYILVDHKSGNFVVKYFFAPGETAANLIDFLYHSWSRREDEKDIMQGAPRLLYFDRGAANLSHQVANLLANLGIEWEAHQAGVSRATGQVEVHHRIWQQSFESRLYLNPPQDLDELNRRADDFRVNFCATRKHSRTGATRLAVWSSIKGDQLRTMPPRHVYNELAHDKPHQTKATRDKVIRYKGEKHLIMSPISVGEALIVIRNAYNLPEIKCHRANPDGTPGAPVETRHIQSLEDIAVPVGEYRREPDSPVQKAMKAADELDLSSCRDAAFGGYIDELPANVHHLERKGSEISPPPPPEDKRPQAPTVNDARALSLAGVEQTPAAPSTAEDPLPRPDFFESLEHRFRWTRKRQMAGLPVTTQDLDAANHFEQSPEYQSMSPDYWERDARELALAI